MPGLRLPQPGEGSGPLKSRMQVSLSTTGLGPGNRLVPAMGSAQQVGVEREERIGGDTGALFHRKSPFRGQGQRVQEHEVPGAGWHDACPSVPLELQEL